MKTTFKSLTDQTLTYYSKSNTSLKKTKIVKKGEKIVGRVFPFLLNKMDAMEINEMGGEFIIEFNIKNFIKIS